MPAIVAVLLTLTVFPSLAAADRDREPFAVPPALAKDVAFWVAIYSEVPSSGGLLHDPVRLDVVYERIDDLPPPDATGLRRTLVDARRSHYAERLRHLAERAPRDAEDARIAAVWRDASADQLRAAAERIRFQSGQADRFREGLERAGAWRPWITSRLAERGLPLEIAALPHVESSFNPQAGSRVGASGMWQFMPATARQFAMRIDDSVDERRDPMRSTEAAIAYLESAYARLGSWPLAIMSYNHGVNGIARARARLGTDDVTRIVREYESPTFKFASRNFYPSFLAALEVERNAARLFPGKVPQQAWSTCTIPLRSSASVAQLARKFSLDAAQLRALNPAVAGAVWSGARKLPPGYAVRVPQDARADASMKSLMAWDRARAEATPPRVLHTVGRGETLARIAARYGTDVGSIAALNGVADPRRLRPGQVLSVGSRSGLC